MPSKRSTVSAPWPATNSNHGEVESFALIYRLKTTVSEDGTKIIPGKFGHIYRYDNGLLGVMVMPDPPRQRYWGCQRPTLIEAGFTLIQDGDGEGAAVFNLNHPKQARLAIRVAGIKRKRQMSPARREQRIAFLRVPSRAGFTGVGAHE